MSPLITDAPRERSNSTVARPMPEEPPSILLDPNGGYYDSVKSCVVPVMTATLAWKPVRSESLIWNSDMMKTKLGFEREDVSRAQDVHIHEGHRYLQSKCHKDISTHQLMHPCDSEGGGEKRQG
jgi:hypothetical protein